MFLSSIQALPPDRLELVLERALAVPGGPVGVEKIKLIVLMVFWSLGDRPNVLVLDELCDIRSTRVAH